MAALYSDKGYISDIEGGIGARVTDFAKNLLPLPTLIKRLRL